jgi:hypothetical protein
MDEEENDEIAAAMGFASFGGTKKRKYDHTNSPKAKADASGANSTKLGVRTKKVAGAQEPENEDENTPTDHLSQAPHALSSAQPLTTPERDSGLEDFLARAQTLPNKSPSAAEVSNFRSPSDQPTADMLSFGGPSISRAELNALRNGVRNEHGDMAYFLSSFVEDPWEKLRKGARV